MIVKKAIDGVFVAEQVTHPGYSVPVHAHADDEEALFVLTGSLTVIDHEREFQMGPGEWAHFARDARHGFRNDTNADVRMLCICTPGLAAAGMFEEIDRAGRAGTLTPEALGELCGRYGVCFA